MNYCLLLLLLKLMLIYSYLIFMVVGILGLDVFFVIWMTRVGLVPLTPQEVTLYPVAGIDSFIVIYESFIVLLHCDKLPNLVWLPHIRAPCHTEFLQHEFTISSQAVVYIFGDLVSTGYWLLVVHAVWDDVILMGLGENIASCFHILHVNRKSIKWSWAGPLQMNVNIEQGSNFVVHDDSKIVLRWPRSLKGEWTYTN